MDDPKGSAGLPDREPPVPIPLRMATRPVSLVEHGGIRTPWDLFIFSVTRSETRALGG